MSHAMEGVMTGEMGNPEIISNLRLKTAADSVRHNPVSNNGRHKLLKKMKQEPVDRAHNSRDLKIRVASKTVHLRQSRAIKDRLSKGRSSNDLLNRGRRSKSLR